MKIIVIGAIVLVVLGVSRLQLLAEVNALGKIVQ